MSKLNITQDGYEFTEEWESPQLPLGYYPLVLEAAKSLKALQKTWDDILEADKDGGVTQYHDAAYPTAILLEIEGMPMGIVRFLDDMPQYCPFKSEKVEEN